jgi:hypothetical protein
MAINVYTPGCHLLTHDDVIGSRRVSYILYLCGSEEKPWKPEWGGALRLYPTEKAEDGTLVPKAEWSRYLPPAWNQLAFFEVVPGESFHDVEEVYDGADGDRTRMAISGWFHIPQKGEDGYIEGLEEELGKKSSLTSLHSKSEQYDRPQPKVVPCPDADETFSADEIDFLLKYVHPTYLTPDTLDQLKEQFEEDQFIQISSFLRNIYEEPLRKYLVEQDKEKSSWPVAVPPHKQKFLYLQPEDKKNKDLSPIEELLNVLFPSKEFQKLLQHATGLKLISRNILARRFRKGMDYTLATGLSASSPAATSGSGMQLEISLSLTPSEGWEKTVQEEEPKKVKKKKGSRLNPDYVPEEPVKRFNDSERQIGGHEIYMAAEDDDPTNDPAIYQAQQDDDDGMLFANYPSWNTLNVALRDEGVLKFMKYVSASAKGDRWDIVGEFGVEEGDSSDDEGEEGTKGEDGEGDDDEDNDDEDDDDEDDDDESDESDESEDSYDGKFDDEPEWQGCSP